MASLTLDQAARASGRSARELRLLLEDGQLRGAVRAGRWHVEPSEVDGLVATGTDPVEPRLREVPHLAAQRDADPAPMPRLERVPGDGAATEELVTRLEQRAIEVARLRGELEALREGRDEHGSRLERELEGLRRQLAEARERAAEMDDVREELARARARLAEAESGHAAQPASPRRPGMSEALTPLFRPARDR